MDDTTKRCILDLQNRVRILEKDSHPKVDFAEWAAEIFRYMNSIQDRVAALEKDSHPPTWRKEQDPKPNPDRCGYCAARRTKKMAAHTKRVGTARKLRAEMGLPPSAGPTVLLEDLGPEAGMATREVGGMSDDALRQQADYQEDCTGIRPNWCVSKGKARKIPKRLPKRTPRYYRDAQGDRHRYPDDPPIGRKEADWHKGPEAIPGWLARDMCRPRLFVGRPWPGLMGHGGTYFDKDGTLRNADGSRSIFDDVDK